jgi:hypothetical protein
MSARPDTHQFGGRDANSMTTETKMTLTIVSAAPEWEIVDHGRFDDEAAVMEYFVKAGSPEAGTGGPGSCTPGSLIRRPRTCS